MRHLKFWRNRPAFRAAVGRGSKVIATVKTTPRRLPPVPTGPKRDEPAQRQHCRGSGKTPKRGETDGVQVTVPLPIFIPRKATAFPTEVPFTRFVDNRPLKKGDGRLPVRVLRSADSHKTTTARHAGLNAADSSGDHDRMPHGQLMALLPERHLLDFLIGLTFSSPLDSAELYRKRNATLRTRLAGGKSDYNISA